MFLAVQDSFSSAFYPQVRLAPTLYPHLLHGHKQIASFNLDNLFSVTDT